MTIKTSIIQIGNSQGIRIPKPLLEQSGLSGEVELAVSNNTIVIQAVSRSRKDWDAAFANMAQKGDDVLLAADSTRSKWDEEEWQWE